VAILSDPLDKIINEPLRADRHVQVRESRALRPGPSAKVVGEGKKARLKPLLRVDVRCALGGVATKKPLAAIKIMGPQGDMIDARGDAQD
jgi:hypothetical protein